MNILIDNSGTGDIIFKFTGYIYNFLLLLLSLSLFPISSIYSEEQDSIILVASVFTHTSDEDPDNSFRDIIDNAILLELKTAGFKIVNQDYTDSMDNPAQSAYISGASILIESKYSLINESLNIDLQYFRADNTSGIFSSSISGALNLELDSVIREGALELITRIKQDIESHPLLIPESTISIEEEKTDEGTSISAEITHSPTEIPVTEPSDFRHFTIAVGFSLFMTTGDASNYFTSGMAPDIYAGYRLHTPFGYLGLGITSSLNYFSADGILLSSENILISTGPEIRLGFDASPFLGIFLRLNGGGTMFMLNKNNEGYQSTIIPFVSGGMGLTLNMIQGFGFVISTNYCLYIESSILITGFSPSAGIYLNL